MVIIPVAKGVAVNPQGFNLVLPKGKNRGYEAKIWSVTEVRERRCCHED